MIQRPDILLIGAGGHARACIDVVEMAGFNIIGIVGQKEEVGTRVLGYPILGTDDDLPSLRGLASLALIAIGQVHTPLRRIESARAARAAGFNFPVVISPSAQVSRHAIVDDGSVVMHRAVVNAKSHVGKHCIVNSGALLEHDSSLGDFTHLSTGAILNGGVQVGQRCFVGSGSIAKHGLVIGNDCLIAMGSILLDDLPDNSKFLREK
jgi:sugar O-acyltransferase (sialic acid O-acetyltransferase NeuD family)